MMEWRNLTGDYDLHLKICFCKPFRRFLQLEETSLIREIAGVHEYVARG